MSKYNKTIAALVTGLIGWSSVVIVSEATKISAPEWVMFATVVATALGVYTVPNAEV